MFVLSETKKCSPQCELFRCVKRAVEFRGSATWCRWAEQECNVSNCSYTTCVKSRLLPDGVCGETLKRKTTEIGLEEAVGPPVKLKGKALRRVGEKEIF